MLLEAIYHRPKNNFSYAYDRDTLHIRLRTKKNDVESVFLIHGDKYHRDKWFEKSEETAMYKLISDKYFDYWQVEVKPPFKRISYYFKLKSGSDEIWMTERGFQNTEHKTAAGVFEFPFINEEDILVIPEWVKDSVFYQIFPERFYNGDGSNDPEGTDKWGNSPHYKSFFGGDLQGVIEKLDYLSELGINAIYFTPLFESLSNHKYDTIDYFKVDPHFGDTKILKELVSKCHDRGIRVVLDAVFNHSGMFFEPFQDVMKNGEASRYRDWFHVRGFPVQTQPIHNYHSFAFGIGMPKLNTGNPEVRDYLLRVARYWIEECDIDGWRLDVANEVDHSFWREFRRVVKETKPEAYILGEIWQESMPWLQGDQFDAVMNYPFNDALLDFFAYENIDAEDFVGRLGGIYAGYPQQATEAAFNLLDSHDTPRLLNLCGEDKSKMKLAVFFQLTYGGVPCIYYGDEVGMTGGKDPDCRRTMVWETEEQDRELFEFYRTLISIRKDNAPLRSGSMRFLYAKDNIVCVERSLNGKQILVLVNNNKYSRAFEIEVMKNTEYLDLLADKKVKFNGRVDLPAKGYMILKKI